MPRFLATAAPLAIIAIGGISLASAQSSSPFASQKKQQAWEQPAPTQAVPAQTFPAQTFPAQQIPTQPVPTYQPPLNQAPAQAAPSYAPPVSGSVYNYAPQTPSVQDFGQIQTVNPQQNYRQPMPQKSLTQSASPSGGYYPGRAGGGQATSGPQYNPTATQFAGQARFQAAPPQAYQGQNYQAPNYQGPNYQGQPFPAPQQPRDWKDRFGLRNIATLLRGGLRTGAALSYRDVPPNQAGAEDGYSEDFIADGDVEFEASAITQGGLEYGVNLEVRAQYDRYRRGFGGRLPLCPPNLAGCAASGTNSLRGHTSQFYQFGEDIAQETEVALESAHLFLRSAYGDVTIGRDDGAAFLFSLGAPTLLAVNASNSPVDYTGLDSVKTVNDASGFSEKVTYTSPRLLGDQIGFGVQFGASYALDADACGVDYCTDRDIVGVVRPELEDVLEVGLALDRTFQNGLSVEGTLTYATATETSGFAELDDLESFGAGLEFAYADWKLGGSWLHSNNGLLNGDYTAYDIGATWKPGPLGFSLAYGHAEDDNVGLTSDQGTFGITYDFERFTLGTGVQYVDRRVNGLIPQTPTTFEVGSLHQKATSVFVEAAVKF